LDFVERSPERNFTEIRPVGAALIRAGKRTNGGRTNGGHHKDNRRFWRLCERVQHDVLGKLLTSAHEPVIRRESTNMLNFIDFTSPTMFLTRVDLPFIVLDLWLGLNSLYYRQTS